MRMGDQALRRRRHQRPPRVAQRDTEGTATRLAAQRLRQARIPLRPLLKRAGTSHFRTMALHLISVLAVTGALAACANLPSLPPEQTEARPPHAAPPRPTATAPAAAGRAQKWPPTPRPRPEASAPELPGQPLPPLPIRLPPKPVSGVAQITPIVHLSLGQAVPASWGGSQPNFDCADILCGRPIQSCLRRSPPSSEDWQDLFRPN